MNAIFEFVEDNYPFIVIAIGMFIVMLPPSQIEKEKKEFIGMFTVYNMFIMIYDYVEKQLGLSDAYVFQRTYVSIICYILRPGLFVMLLYMMGQAKDLKRKLFIWIPFIINALLYTSALWTDVVFSYNECNKFVRGPLGFAIHLISLIYLIWLLIISMKLFTERNRITDSILIFCAISIYGAIGLDSFWDSHQLNATIFVTFLFYYIFLYTEYENKFKKEQREQLKEQRDALMISQIQPHFIYNTLNTVYYLCMTNPELAGETVVKFSDYLRNNLTTGNEPEKLVEVEKEIEHTKNYADIEKLRFKNINVIYDIKETGFLIPALSIQPMVENAIRHGIQGKENGLVTVKTYSDEDDYVVQIIDNGVGCVQEGKQLGKHAHIGIKNVKERIQVLCHGTLDIEMVKDQGTTVTMRIPKLI